MKYFKKQTLRFEKAWNLKDLRKERTLSVMFLLPFFEQKEGSMKKRRGTGRCFVLFSSANGIKILIPYDQISRMKYKQ